MKALHEVLLASSDGWLLGTPADAERVIQGVDIGAQGNTALKRKNTKAVLVSS